MKVITIIKTHLLFLALLFTNTLLANTFQTELEQSKWGYKGDKFSCRIFHDIHQFGKLSLIASPANPLAIEIESQWLNFENTRTHANVIVPSWHHENSDAFPSLELNSKDKQQASAIDDKLTLYLKAIAKGYSVEVVVTAATNEQFSGIANSVDTKEIINKFRHCYAQLLPKPYSYVRRVELIFDSASSKLNSLHENDLNAVAEYVKADDSIAKVLVDAHTDGNGHHLANLVLSKERAGEVASRLAELGLSVDMIEVRHHGERMPLAANTTEKGRSINRRVTVKLVKRVHGANR